MKRVCAICETGNQPGEIFAFDELLRDLEIKGRYAHPACVMDEQRKQRSYIKKHGAEQCH